MPIGNMLAAFGNRPSVLQDVEANKNVALTNRLNQYKIESSIRDEQKKNRLSELYARRVSGDKTADAEIAALDPEVHMTMQKNLLEMEKGQREQLMTQLEESGRMALAADSPDKWSQLFPEVPFEQRGQLIARASAAKSVFDAIQEQEKQAYAQQKDAQAFDLQRRGQDITLRGQNLTDARSREQNMQGRVPAGYRQTADGNLEAIPGGPADIKAQKEADMRVTGATDVDIALQTLRDAYDRLESGGGITSTKDSALSNIPAGMSSSGLGQGIGKIIGSSNQSARNEIAMTRPALLAALMRATGMSAKQMDSNAELKLWLSTATDPTLDVESNRKALDNIEKKYLTPYREPATTSPETPAGIDPQLWQHMTPEERALWK